MANDVHLKITVDGSQVQTETNKIRGEFYSINDAIAQTGKNISQVNQELTTVNRTMSRPTKYDTVGRADNAVNKLGRSIKQLRVHGVDPVTNSIARFINVVGGGMFNTVTFAITIVMGLFYALKKVNNELQNYYKALSTRADTLIKISKQRVKDTQDEKKQIQGVIEQLKKMNEKQKLSNIEQNITLSLVQQIKNKWGQIGIQIDKNTGKVKNFNEVQARLNKKQIEQNSKELETQLKLQNTKLDLTLSKYTGKTSIFSQLMRSGGDPREAFKAFDIFKGKSIEDITIFDLFPGLINNYDDKEAVKKIDLGKLFFGDTDTQIEFFRQVASHLTNLDAFTELNELIDGLLQKSNIQKALNALVDPTGENVRRAKEIQASISKAEQTAKKTQKQLNKVSQDSFKFAEKWAYDQLTTEQKLKVQNRKYADTQQAIAEFTSIGEEFTAKWKDKFYDRNGQPTSQQIDAVLERNQKVGNLYAEYQKIQQKYQPQLNALIGSQALYDQQKMILDTYKREMSQEFRFKPPTYSYEEAHRAQQWIKEEGPRIEMAWKVLKEKMAEERKKAFDELKLQGNDLRDAKILDQEQNKLDEYNRDVIALGENIQLLSQYSKENQQALTQITRLQKQLADERAAAVKAMQDQFAELEKMVAEEAKVTQQRKSFLTGMGNSVIEKFMQDTGQQYSLRRQQIERQIMQELGVTSLTANQKSIAGRLAYIEQLQSAQQLEDRLDTFKYGVKTNELASKGGWNSSVYISGRDSIAQENLRTNQNQQKILVQINKLLPELKKQMNTLNKNLQI